MKRRVKKRTQARVAQVTAPTNRDIRNNPKSMVIRIGASELGPSLSQLVKDVRKTMEPGTATRLKERKSNKLRDYTSICAPLGVTHLLLFSRTPSGNVNLRIAVSPQGPTLHFRVPQYSLCKDIFRMSKHYVTPSNAYLQPPILVMNNFVTRASGNEVTNNSKEENDIQRLEELCVTVFQSLFPPINPKTMPLSGMKRVLLLNRDTSSHVPNEINPTCLPTNSGPALPYTLTFRHYAITTRPVGFSRPLKRLRAAERNPHSSTTGCSKKQRRGLNIPNLGGLVDVSEWILNADDPSAMGYTSASESEVDSDAHVEIGVSIKKKVKLQSAPQRDSDTPESKSKATSEGNVIHDDVPIEQSTDTNNGLLESNSHSRDNTTTGYVTSLSVEKRAIKLVEIGPRLTLRLFKIEEGLCQGNILWNETNTSMPV